MLSAIETAAATVALESYIFGSDSTGRRFVDALTRAAQRGVRVRVMIDGLGSLGTGTRFFLSMLQAGGELVIYQGPSLWPPAWFLWRRDHRKLLVVDQQRAFIGGLNIGDAYAPADWGGGAWHDTHMEVKGPVAHALAKVFARTWAQQSKKHWRLGPPPPPCGPTAVSILESRLTQRLSIRHAYMTAIRSATRSVCICNAYCIPDRGILRAMRNACKRGVKIQLILAGTTDMRAVQFASRALYARMMRYGVEIYEWTDRVLHAKSAVVDGVWCSVGSYNMDRRSLLHNLEANIACEDVTLGTALASQFDSDLRRSQRIRPEGWHRRSLLQKLLEQICYNLRYLL